MYHLVGIEDYVKEVYVREDYVNFTTSTPAPNTKIKFASASKLASTTAVQAFKFDSDQATQRLGCRHLHQIQK